MPRAGRDERAWVRGAQAGLVSDLEALFRSHWPRAYRAAYLVVHDAAAAEDIAQEAFLSAARPRLLRPPPSLRPLAAPDRGQPGDRLGLREGAAAGGRRRSPPGCAGSRPIRLRRRSLQGWARRSPPSPGPSRRDRPPLLARVHTRRDRLDARTTARDGQPVSAAAWTRSRQMSWRSVNDGSGAAQPSLPTPPRRGRRANAPGPWCKRPTARESGCLGSSGIRGRCWPCSRPSRSESPQSPRPAAHSSSGCEAAGVTRRSLRSFASPALAGSSWSLLAARGSSERMGRKRRLGDYEEASWSPRGLFVVATSDRRVVALEPDGDVRWTVTRPRPVTTRAGLRAASASPTARATPCVSWSATGRTTTCSRAPPRLSRPPGSPMRVATSSRTSPPTGGSASSTSIPAQSSGRRTLRNPCLARLVSRRLSPTRALGRRDFPDLRRRRPRRRQPRPDGWRGLFSWRGHARLLDLRFRDRLFDRLARRGRQQASALHR